MALHVYVRVTPPSDDCITWHMHYVGNYQWRGGGSARYYGKVATQDLRSPRRGAQRRPWWVGLEVSASTDTQLLSVSTEGNGGGHEIALQ